MNTFTTIDVMLETISQPQPGMPELPQIWKAWLYVQLNSAKKEVLAMQTPQPEDRPICGKCNGVLTPENSTIHPEYFLHDKCLPSLEQGGAQ